MPLFQRRFSVPKFPDRKSSSMSNLSQLDASTRSQEFSLSLGPVKAKLSGRELVFKNGQWVVSDPSGSDVDMTVGSLKQSDRDSFHVKKENVRLVEENNLLRLKVDLLLDMLAETTAEVHLQENELDSLREMVHHNNSKSHHASSSVIASSSHHQPSAAAAGLVVTS